MNNQAAQTMPYLIVERLAAVKDHFPAGTDERKAVWQAIEYFRAAAISQTAGVPEVGRVCKWHQQDEGYDTFSTGCGHEYTVNECTDGNVQLPYCPFCAKPLIGIAWNEDDYVSLSEALSSSAAAPAASGGESHPDALQDGTLSKSTVKWVEALAAASVSERARALLAAEYERDGFDPAGAQQIREGFVNNTTAMALRAIEQALTQQRGECEPLGYTALFNAIAAATWPQTKGVGINVSVDRFRDSIGGDVFTTPQPSADAVREVIGSMRNFADVADKCELTEGNAQVAIRAWATQLESLLSGGSHA